MKIDWIATIGHAVAIAVVIVLLIATFARGVLAPSAVLGVAGVSAAVALWLFVRVSFAGFSRAARGDADTADGSEVLRAITRLNDDQWGCSAFLRIVLFAQVLVVVFVFGPDTAEFLAAFSAFAISILLGMRQLKDVNSSR
jgi:hypothetical protein